MVKRLKEVCLVAIGQNLHRIKHVGKHLPTVHKEQLIEYLAFHDMYTEFHLPHATYNLFSPSLKHINLHKCAQIDDQFLKQLSHCGPQLTHLTIHGCANVSDKGILHITARQASLEVLQLRKLQKLTHEGLTQIMSPALWKVDLRGNNSLSSAGLKLFVVNNPSIKELDLTACVSLDDTIFVAIADSLAHNLEFLNLSDLHFLSDSSLIYIAEKCPNLMKLILHGCNRITNEPLMQVSDKCKKMSHLDLSYCHIDKGHEADCLNRLPVSLSQLSLCGVLLEQQQHLVDCVNRLVNLRDVRLCGIPAINDDSLDQILSTIGDKLECLDLSGSVTNHLTDEGFRAIPKYCNNLRELATSLLPEITGNTLIPLFHHPQKAASIRHLKMSNRKLDTEVLYAVASGCKNLEGLSVAGLTSVDDQILFALAENCPKLYYLNLKGCRMVTDVGICEVARCCPLTGLVVAGLHEITDKSIFALASSCVYLEAIYLNGCSKISPVALLYLLDCCMPRLYIEHKVPNAPPNQLMAKNLDTGEFCRADLIETS